MKKIHILSITLFLLALWLPPLQMHFGLYKEFDDTENREMAAPPRWAESSYSKLLQEIDSYVGDHFGFRPDLIRWNSFLRLNILRASPIRSVIPGKGPWLYYCSEALADGNSMNDYMGMIPLPAGELEKLRLRLEENRRRFSERGIHYVVAIAPNKHTIYEEYLPERIRACKSNVTRLGQFFDYMALHSDLEVLDLRRELLPAKQQHPVYWETDSHWNTYGAYLGYLEIFRGIRRQFPEAAPVGISGAVAVERTTRGGDLAQMLFLTDVLPESNHTSFTLGECSDSSRFRKLIFRHDSFGDNMYPFLRKHFEKIVNIAPFAPFRFEEIDKERPEIVVHLFTERYLTQAVHDDFFYQEGG